MKRNAIYTLIACLFLAACSSEEEWMISDDQTPAIELGEDQIAVQLNLQTTDFTVEETRSANPIELKIENPMYNLWLLHYNEEGGLVESDTEYIHLNDKGELSTNHTAKLTLTDSNKGTLCLIANLEGTVGGNNPSTASVPNNDNRAWPKTLQLLQKELLTLPINRNATDAKLGLPSKMFMYGFYQGTLSTSHPVNITLGRMAARLDIVIKAADSESTLSNLRLQLKNAVIKSHYSPMKVGSEENIYVDFPEDNTFKDKEVTSSSPITCYYFTGENITPESGKETVLIVTSLIDPKVLERAKSGCADSLWYKDHGEEEIGDVISRTLKGERVFPDMTPDVELNWITSGEVSPRQLEMLRLYICGMSYSEIAKKMNCSTSGVRWNFQEMIARAGYSCKEDLIAAALESKLIVTTLK